MPGQSLDVGTAPLTLHRAGPVRFAASALRFAGEWGAKANADHVWINLEANNLADRQLVDDMGSIRSTSKCTENAGVMIDAAVSVSDLKANWFELATEAACKVYNLFNWDPKVRDVRKYMRDEFPEE